jgi:hypothetical protein
MWGSRRNWDDEQVTCIACGDSVARTDAREYDKYGDRWDRRDKEFEYLCKDCYRDLCHQPRADLEAILVESADDADDRDTFLERYQEFVEERSDTAGQES